MIHARPLTFQQALKKNLKRVLTYWAPLSVIFAGMGTLLGFYTLSTYATAIGRPDVMAAADYHAPGPDADGIWHTFEKFGII